MTTEREFKIAVIISDIHIGRQSISPESFKHQLETQFLDVIKDFKYLDGIFITGDMMHTIVSLNSEYAEVFHWFTDQVYKLAKKKHSTVIIIRGTGSHDANQLDNIKHYQSNDDGVDFRVYDTIEEITIWDDYRVLILPDIKVRQKKEIDQYLEKEKYYDLILGHGTTDSMQYFIQESEALTTKTYLYDVDRLIYCCKGPIFFGHIHQPQVLRKQFYYVGSFTTLERGVNNAGFLVCGIFENDRRKYRVERYLNKESAEYHELTLDRNVLSDYPIDDIIEAIDLSIKDAKPNDLITLRISLGDERDAADKVAILEERYRKDKRFSIVKKVKTRREEESEKRNEALRDRYSYLMDPNPDMPAIIYKYYVEDVYPTMSEESRKRVNLTESIIRDVLEKKLSL